MTTTTVGAMLHVALAVASALVSLAFAMSTFERWILKRSPHHMAWTASLTMFTLAAGCLAAGEGLGWTGPLFRSFYLFGAILNVPFLALGTVYLLWSRRWGDRAAQAIGLLSAFAVGVVMVAPLTHPVPLHGLARGSEVFGALPRILAAICSGGGAVVVLGGAVRSALKFRRGRMFIANLLIAIGTLIIGASGLLNSVLDQMNAFSVTLLLGIAVIFGGFLVASAPATPGN